MRRWAAFIAVSAAYFPLAAIVIVFLTAAHGDCGTEEGNDVSRCLIEKRIIFLGLIAVALLAYGFICRALFKGLGK